MMTSGTRCTTGPAAAASLPYSSPIASTRWHGVDVIGRPSSDASRVGSAALSVLSAIMESAPVYRIWQAPYARQKLALVRRHNDLRRALRVLDVGCGPGTNTPAFTHARYEGTRSEEHTSELQSHVNLVCRLLLEKKNTATQQFTLGQA